MSYTFNPFTGNFDYYQSGSSGITFPDLASPPASTALGSSGAKYTNLFLSGTLQIGSESYLSRDYPLNYYKDWTTATGLFTHGSLAVENDLDVPANLGAGRVNVAFDFVINDAGVFTYSYFTGLVNNLTYNSSSQFDYIHGTDENTFVFNGTGGVSAGVVGKKLSTGATGTTNVNYVVGIWNDVFADAAVPGAMAYYSPDLTGAGALNNYFLWSDSPGVFRVKADGVLAYYNPTFTKYTPGAVNYERIVQQWETDVATIRTEAGGTGTLRSINLAGATVQLNGKTITLADSFITSGNFSLTLTTTNTTNVTLPTTGTLATLAGAESLTNKKLGSLTSNGFVKTSGGDGTLSVDTATYLTSAVTSIATTSPISGGTITGTGTISLLVNTNFNWTAGQTITAPAGSTALTLAGGTQTSSFPALDIAQAWNASGTTFTGLKLNITNTASAAASKILSLQVGGNPQIDVSVTGVLRSYSGATVQAALGDGAANSSFPGLWLGSNATTPTLSNYALLTNGTSTYINAPNGVVTLRNANVDLASGTTSGFVLNSTKSLGFSSTTDTTLAADTFFVRGAAATFQMGADVNGAAVNQMLQACNGITGTDKTGGNLTIASGKGTGAGAVSSLIFQTPTVTTTGTTAQALATRLTLTSTSATFAPPIIASAAGFATGIYNDGSGFKHARTTTGSVGIGSTALVTITWSTAFADANYTVSVSVVDSTTTSLSLSVVHIESVVAGSITVRVINNSATTALTGTLHAVAVHD